MGEGVSCDVGTTRAPLPADSTLWSKSDVAAAAAGAQVDQPLSFHDVLNAINPLQQLPVVGTIYRAVTGETVQPGLRIGVSMVTGAVFGGPLGVLGTIASTFFEEFLQMGANIAPSAAPYAEAGSPAAASSASADRAIVSA